MTAAALGKENNDLSVLDSNTKANIALAKTNCTSQNFGFEDRKTAKLSPRMQLGHAVARGTRTGKSTPLIRSPLSEIAFLHARIARLCEMGTQRVPITCRSMPRKVY